MVQTAIERIEDIVVAVIAGESLDASNAKDFKQGITPLLSANPRVIIDLRHVQFVDSSGLGALLSCLRQVHAAGGELKLCGMLTPVRSLFELVRMNRIFEILPTQAEAIDAFQRNRA